MIFLYSETMFGEMLEWLKRHAWKACKRQKRFGGSNPPLSAENPCKSLIYRDFLRLQTCFHNKFTKFLLFCNGAYHHYAMNSF